MQATGPGTPDDTRIGRAACAVSCVCGILQVSYVLDDTTRCSIANAYSTPDIST